MIVGSIARHYGLYSWKDRVVIAEVKHSEKGSLETLLKEAFEQINDRRYYEGFAGDNRRIALLAIAVAGREIECRMEELKSII